MDCIDIVGASVDTTNDIIEADDSGAVEYHEHLVKLSHRRLSRWLSNICEQLDLYVRSSDDTGAAVATDGSIARYAWEDVHGWVKRNDGFQRWLDR
jgi:hypothetical protein